MNGTIEKRNYEAIMAETVNTVNEEADCQVKSSTFSMAAVASGILLCVGIVIYAILTH